MGPPLFFFFKFGEQAFVGGLTRPVAAVLTTIDSREAIVAVRHEEAAVFSTHTAEGVL